MDKSIRVRILGRDYALRVRAEHEADTRAVAALVDERMQAFRQAFPDQPELTAAVVTALGLAEEVTALRRTQARAEADLAADAATLERALADALGLDADEEAEEADNAEEADEADEADPLVAAPPADEAERAEDGTGTPEGGEGDLRLEEP